MFCRGGAAGDGGFAPTTGSPACMLHFLAKRAFFCDKYTFCIVV